jgi:hypothetical protein
MRTSTICLLVAAAFHAVTTAQTPVARALTMAWSLEGRWWGIASNESAGVIYAVGPDRTAEIDIAGQIRRETPPLRCQFDCRRYGRPSERGAVVAGRGVKLRLARLPHPTLLTFSIWLADLRAHDLNGNQLWTYPHATGIDDVWTSDLDGDQSDEVIVGFNGDTGVHVIDGKGQLQWASTAIGGVRQVTAGDVLGQGRPQIVTTGRGVGFHIFSGDGERDVLTPGILGAQMVRVQKVSAEDNAATIFVAGRKATAPLPFTTSLSPPRRWAELPPATVVAALSADGARKWTLELPPIDVTVADVAVARPWLALGTRSGQVYVIDAVRGGILGVVEAQGAAEVAWAGNPPLLVVAAGAALNAFHVSAP